MLWETRRGSLTLSVPELEIIFKPCVWAFLLCSENYISPYFTGMFPSHPLKCTLPKTTKAAFELDLGPSPGVTLPLKIANSESRLLEMASVALPKPTGLPRAQLRRRSLMW